MIHDRVETLTPRERQVMARVIRGRLNKQIAAELGTGEKTVKVHRARMMSQMVARSVAKLAQLGVRVGVGGGPRHASSELCCARSFPGQSFWTLGISIGRIA